MRLSIEKFLHREHRGFTEITEKRIEKIHLIFNTMFPEIEPQHFVTTKSSLCSLCLLRVLCEITVSTDRGPSRCRERPETIFRVCNRVGNSIRTLGKLPISEIVALHMAARCLISGGNQRLFLPVWCVIYRTVRIIPVDRPGSYSVNSVQFGCNSGCKKASVIGDDGWSARRSLRVLDRRHLVDRIRHSDPLHSLENG